jgi:hypothetical protein
MPVFVAIGAYVAATGAGIAIASALGISAAVFGGIVALGAAYVTSRIINGNPNKGNNSAAGSQGGRIQVPPATNNKIPVVYGNSFVNGTISDARLITTDQTINDTMFYCIVLSETCNDPAAAYAVNNIFWNDLRLTAVDSTTNAHKIKDGRKNVDDPDTSVEDFIDTNFIVNDKSLVEVRVYAGSTAAADQIYPLQSSGNTQAAYDFWGDNDNSWTNDWEMKGLVFAIVRLTYNGEKGFTNLANVTVQLDNSISNPADVWYDYMTSARYGAGIPDANIDGTARTAWKNFCDEDIAYTNKDGTTNQATTRYSINGPIDTSRPVKENIDTIMQNGGAWLSYEVATGYWKPIIKKAVSAGEIGLPATYFTASRSGSTLTVTAFPAGRIEAGQLLYNSSGTLIGTVTAQLAPTAGETAGQKGRYTTSTSGSISSTTFYTLPASMLAFTDDNISSGIAISGTRLDDLYNSYEVEFFDKHNKDQRAYARDSILVGERNPNEPDNQLRLSLGLCNNSMQADILGGLELRQSRDDLTVEFTTTHFGIQANAGDVISITSPLYDWNPKYFRVMRVREQETDQGLGAQIQALEYNPDVYTVESITEFSTSANIGIGVWGASPNMPQPPVVVISEIDTDVAIPNFLLQIKIPETGGPYDEIELYYTEGWDPMSMTGTIVPGTGSNGAPVGDGLLTVTAVDYGALEPGDYFVVGATSFTITEQLTNNPVSKTFVSGGAVQARTITLNNTTGLKVGNRLAGTGIPASGARITVIAGSVVTLDTPFVEQAAGTYNVFGGLGTYVVDTSATLSGTTTLFDLPVDSSYQYLKKHTPQGNNPTFVNGETVGIVITEVPANTATYRRWFIKARMGIRKRFGRFSSPTITDRDGNFRYTPSPTGGGSLNDLTDVEIVSPNEGQTLYYDATVGKWKNNSILEVDDTATFGGIVVGEGITQPMITFAEQPDGANGMYGIRGKSTVDDPWFIGAGSTGDDAGYLEIATGDNTGDPANNASPIYVRQYNGYASGGVPWYSGGGGVVVNEFTLLDNNGDTSIPNNVTISGATESTSQSTGALKVAGGVGIIKNLHVGGTIRVDNGDEATDTTTGSIQTDGGVGITKKLHVGGTIRVDDTEEATNFTSGSIQTDGGVGITKKLHVGGTVRVDDTEEAINPTSGSIQTDGGVGIAKKLHVGGTVKVDDTLNATTAGSASITTDGGIGLVKDIYVGGDIILNGREINSSVGVTAIRLMNANDVEVVGDLTVTGNNINSAGAPVIEFFGASSANVRIENDLEVKGGTISSGTSDLELYATTVTVPNILKIAKIEPISAVNPSIFFTGGNVVIGSGGLQIEANTIAGNTGTTAITMSGADVTIADDLIVTDQTTSNSYLTNTLHERTATTVTTTSTSIINLVVTTRPCIRATISVARGTNVQAMEVLVRRDAGTAFITIYADISDAGSLVTLTADMDGATNNLLLQATPTSSTSTTFVTLADSIGVALA